MIVIKTEDKIREHVEFAEMIFLTRKNTVSFNLCYGTDVSKINNTAQANCYYRQCHDSQLRMLFD